MRILCFGDSITQGFHDTELGGWTNRLSANAMQKEIESGYEYNREVINLGISGDTTADVLKRVKAEIAARVLKFPPSSNDHDVLLLAVGVNDSIFNMENRENEVTPETMRSNLEEIEQQTKALVSKLVIVGIAPVIEERVQPMPWAPTIGYANDEIVRYDTVLQQFASERGHIFVHMGDVFGQDIEACVPDGVHPNAEGHRRIYERVKTELEKVDIL